MAKNSAAIFHRSPSAIHLLPFPLVKTKSGEVAMLAFSHFNASKGSRNADLVYFNCLFFSPSLVVIWFLSMFVPMSRKGYFFA